jgi:competence protein ComEC
MSFFTNTKKLIASTLTALLISLPAYAKDLTVSYIDIGQGDSELIELPDGKNILIDAGDQEGSAKLISYLKERNIKDIDLVIISHPHLDHYGGLLKAVKNLNIKQIYDSGAPTNSSTYLKLLKLLNEKKVKLTIARRNQELKFNDGINLKILAPEDPLFDNTRSDTNNASIVAKLTHNKVSFLFTGDIEEESQDRMIKNVPSLLDSTILKVAHHGSRYTTSDEFLSFVKPKIAVISCEEGNSYGHPHKETLDRLKKNKIPVYRTDLSGNIIVTSDGNDYKIQTKKSSIKTKAKAKKVNLNTATAEELEVLSGINAKKAKTIVSLRPITSWEQLNTLGLTSSELKELKKEASFKKSTSKSSSDSKTVSLGEKVNINTATAKELEALPAIGDKTAEKIINGRPYKSISDLEKVKGITKKSFEKFKNLISI